MNNDHMNEKTYLFPNLPILKRKTWEVSEDLETKAVIIVRLTTFICLSVSLYLHKNTK